MRNDLSTQNLLFFLAYIKQHPELLETHGAQTCVQDDPIADPAQPAEMEIECL